MLGFFLDWALDKIGVFVEMVNWELVSSARKGWGTKIALMYCRQHSYWCCIMH